MGKFCFVDNLRWRKRCPVTRCVMVAYASFGVPQNKGTRDAGSANPAAQALEESGQRGLSGSAFASPICDPKRVLILVIWVSKVSHGLSQSSYRVRIDEMGGCGGVWR
jgi:hypothetical protein